MGKKRWIKYAELIKEVSLRKNTERAEKCGHDLFIGLSKGDAEDRYDAWKRFLEEPDEGPHIVENGKIEGNSGPFYPDSIETTWANIGVEEERTTVTNIVRRVATFSMIQYKRMLKAFRPDYILLNFTNYLSKKQFSELLKELPEVTHISNGPKIRNIKRIGTKIVKYDPHAYGMACMTLWSENQKRKNEKEKTNTGTPG